MMSVCNTFPRTSHGCYGRMERQAVLLETRICITWCHLSLYSNSTKLGAYNKPPLLKLCDRLVNITIIGLIALCNIIVSRINGIVICLPSPTQTLTRTLYLAFPELLKFLLCAFILFIAFALCGWIVLGSFHPKVHN